jgi:heme-degrading monooxygenase HmoA
VITEIASLKIIAGETVAFEKAFNKARHIISAMNGFIELELQKCLEETEKYLLIVRWEKLEDHTEGFRKSESYTEWKKLLHHFYNPFPTVEHYTSIY